MPVIIEMPKLSDTMTVGTLIKWLKKEGDVVKAGDLIAEVETDKATMEIENFESGTLLKHFVQAGQQVPIGSPIAAIGKPGEAVPEVGGAAPAPKAAAEKPAPVAQAPAVPQNIPCAPPQSILPTPVLESNTGRIRSSPLARKIAAQHNVPLNNLQGSGPNGRIVKVDVLAVLQSNGVVSSKATDFMPTPAALPRSVPISNMRRTIAKHLHTSKSTIPHFYLTIDVDAEPVLKLREQINDALKDLPEDRGGMKLTVNDFVLKATVEAIRRVPAVNASWNDPNIDYHSATHLSFGVAIEDGLVTPVIQNAHAKSLRQIATEAKSLVAKARNKKLTPNEMAGSTFTVTNLGMFGIDGFYGIINPPNAAILSVGAAIKQPVVNDKNEIVVGYRMKIGLSGDHRVVDGATGAQFQQKLKSCLEKPAVCLL